MSDTQAQALESARIVDQNPAAGIAPEDMLIIDSIASGTRAISYQALCDAVAVTLGKPRSRARQMVPCRRTTTTRTTVAQWTMRRN